MACIQNHLMNEVHKNAVGHSMFATPGQKRLQASCQEATQWVYLVGPQAAVCRSIDNLAEGQEHYFLQRARCFPVDREA